MEQNTDRRAWSENVIVADADYVDSVAFNLTVNFERMLGRRIPQADMARWVECAAMDGGVPVPQTKSEAKENDASQGDDPTAEATAMQTQVVLIHDKQTAEMKNFRPSALATEIDGQAFSGPLGEFVFGAYPVESLTTKGDFLIDVVETMLQAEAVKRLIIVPNAEDEALVSRLRQTLRQANSTKRITILAMQPLQGGPFQQDILGYSLMQALGIRAKELG